MDDFEWLTEDGQALVRRALAIAYRSGHQDVDALHLLLALWDEPWFINGEDLEELGLSREGIVADLNRRYGEAEVGENMAADLPGLSPGLRAAFELARKQTDSSLASWELLVGVWMAPGDQARLLVRTRGRAVRLIREKARTLRPRDRGVLFLSRLLRSARAGRNMIRRSLETNTAGQLLFGGLDLLSAGWRGLLRVIRLVTAPLEFALFAPGIGVREGTRIVLARLAGTRRVPASDYRELGWGYRLHPLPQLRRHAVVQLVPSLVVFAVGVAGAVPSLIHTVAYGTALEPAISSNIGDLVRADERSLFVIFAVLTDPVTWFAFACMFSVLPTLDVVREALFELRVGGPQDRALAVLLFPLLLVSWLSRPTAWLSERLGLSPLFGTGLVSMWTSLLIASAIARGVVGT